MSVTVYRDVDFGSAYSGLSTVGYKVVDDEGATIVARTTTGVVALGGGCYGANITVPDDTVGTIYWDTTDGGSIYAVERIDVTGAGQVIAADGLDNVVVESGLNARQALSIIASAVGGVLSGAGAVDGIVTIKGAGVSTTRITAQTTSEGNRTSITLNPPA